MKVKDLVEAMVLSRTHLVIKDNNNKQVAYVSGGYESEYSEYAESEVMEINSVQLFQIIAHIWLYFLWKEGEITLFFVAFFVYLWYTKHVVKTKEGQ